MKKTPRDIIILHKCTKNHDHMQIWHVTDVTVIFHFGLFLPFYSPNKPKNENFKKTKNTWIYHHFTKVYQRSLSYAILFLRYGA